MRPQFSIRTLLIGVLLIALCLASARAFNYWYAHKYTAHNLFSHLHDRIHNGDTFQKVVRYFKTTEKVESTTPYVQKLWSARSWDIQPGDEIWRFGERSNGVYLQFRDGRLINHSNSDYANPDQVARLNGDSVPPMFFRYGVWPLCIVILGVGGLMIIAIERRAAQLRNARVE